MKMYVFPGDEPQKVLEQLGDKPLVSRNFDAAILRFGVFALTWMAGAAAAAMLSQLS